MNRKSSKMYPRAYSVQINDKARAFIKVINVASFTFGPHKN